MGRIVKKLCQNQKGAISILIVLIVPILIMGTVFLYTTMKRTQKENQAYKIAYAVSDTYLSKYNDYMFGAYGILCTKDEGRFEQLMGHYFVANNFIGYPDEMNVDVSYHSLNNYVYFRESLLHASSVMIETAVIQHLLSYTKLLEMSNRVQDISSRVQTYENQLIDAFDTSGATDILEKLQGVTDVSEGKKSIEAIMTLFSDKEQAFVTNALQIKETLTQAKNFVDDPEVYIESYVDSKLEALAESEQAFMSSMDFYTSKMTILDQLYDRIEQSESSWSILEAEINRIKNLTLTQVSKDALIQALLKEQEVLLQEIDVSRKTMEETITACLLNETNEPNHSFLEGLRQIIVEIDSLFSGVETNGGKLTIPEGIARILPETGLTSLALQQKVMVSEYLLGIFSSYDKKCPRKMDPFNRMEAKRQIKGEVEYLISGIEDEKQSVSEVRMKIMLIREVANLVSIVTDSNKINQILSSTSAIPQPWRSAVFGVAVLAWSSAESYVDVNQLMKGEGFYYLKSADQWHLDFQSLLSGAWKNQSEPLNSETTHFFDAKLYYQDYLRILLYSQSEEKTLLRAMDLIESELYEVSDQSASLMHFSIAHEVRLSKISEDKVFLRFVNQYN